MLNVRHDGYTAEDLARYIIEREDYQERNKDAARQPSPDARVTQFAIITALSAKSFYDTVNCSSLFRTDEILKAAAIVAAHYEAM